MRRTGISGMLGHLPVGVVDPVDRLAGVQAGVAHGREAGTPAIASAVLGLVDRTVPAAIQDVAVAAVGRTAPAWFMDTLTTNVPGPQFPVYLWGRRVVAMYPVIPVAGHTCITTGIFSYNGTLNIGGSPGTPIRPGTWTSWRAGSAAQQRSWRTARGRRIAEFRQPRMPRGELPRPLPEG